MSCALASFGFLCRDHRVIGRVDVDEEGIRSTEHVVADSTPGLG